jgi:hypothetical protein
MQPWKGFILDQRQIVHVHSPFSSGLCLLGIIASFVMTKGAQMLEASFHDNCVLEVPRQLT